MMLNEAKLFLLDMDGTLYLGDEVFFKAHEFVEKLARTGRKYVYLTNNSSRSGEDYIKRLRALHFPCEKENVFTSGMATALYLNEHFSHQGVYVVGTRALKKELESYGVSICPAESANVVAVGFDRELTYEKLEKASRLIKNGAAFIAANPDLVCPMPKGVELPDCGSICALLTAATGKNPTYIGKPNRRMVDIIAKQFGVANQNVAVVGDRLYTDIAVAFNAGAISVLVLSGETNKETLEASQIKPDYVFQSVADIIEVI